MGADADATIIYGCPFGEFDNDAEYDSYHNDPDTWLAKHQGLPEPEGDCRLSPEAWKAYCDAKHELPLTIEYSGNSMCDDGTHYLSIHVASFRGSWDAETKIPVDHIKPPPPEWDTLFREFFKTAGMPYQQPDWYLIVSYG